MSAAGDLEGLLEASRRSFRAGVEARSRAEFAEARRHFLLAAEKLLLAARMSSGALKESRKKLAAGLQAEADALPSRPAPPVPLPRARPLSAEEEEQTANWLVQERPQVSFNDIAGLEDVKEQIRLRLLYPFIHPELAAQYRIQAGGGILLYGPPGTGKTMIARAVAGEINAAFFSIKPSEIMSQWVGVAEQNMSRLFSEAARYPLSVLFIDEMEALAPRRRSSGSSVMVRVVPQLLAELDGFEKRPNPLLLVGASNEPWAIDAAILRPGRLDRLIYVSPPDDIARKRILELNLEHVPLATDLDLQQVAEHSQGFSGADMAALARQTRERGFFEAIRLGQICLLSNQDFEAELLKMRPSISPADLSLYEQFGAGGELKGKKR